MRASEGWAVRSDFTVPGGVPSAYLFYVGCDTERESEDAVRQDPRTEPGSRITAVRRLTRGDIDGIRLQKDEVRDPSSPTPPDAV